MIFDIIRYLLFFPYNNHKSQILSQSKIFSISFIILFLLDYFYDIFSLIYGTVDLYLISFINKNNDISIILRKLTLKNIFNY